MPLGTTREKVLYGLSKGRSAHRYTRWRWSVALFATAAVALLPLTGTLRFDLWGGRHLWLGEELGVVEVTRAFAFPFLAINVVILLVTRFVGRYLCGFACPYGAMARISEWLQWHGRRTKNRLLGNLGLLLFSLVLAAVTFSFWVDWRVFTEGSNFARGLSAGFILGTTAALFALARFMGLRFCRDWCPSGVYFAVLGFESSNGIEFAHPEACTECKACERVCPMDLSPKEMITGPNRGGEALYPSAATDLALCIRCGDCVKACEGTTGKADDPTPLRMGFLPSEREPAGVAAEAGADSASLSEPAAGPGDTDAA